MVEPIFIAIRGNSGIGKTTLAKKLQEYFTCEQCLLLQEDILRREILHVKERPDSPTRELRNFMVNLGLQNYQVTILEGILPKQIYGGMLKEFYQRFGKNAYFYCLDVPFEQTVQNNRQKDNPFAQTTLKKWWLENDFLTGIECKITSTSLKQCVKEAVTNIKQTN